MEKSEGAARRQKQRKKNVLHAEQMHRLRLADLAQDELFEVAGEQAALPHRQETPRYHIGCSGWFYWEWRDMFYPANLPSSGWFSHYAEHFKTVEINASFYSWPTLPTVKNWLKQAGDKEFLYTVKVCELITHTRRFEDTHTLVEDFAYIARLLGARMGCFLFQLPPGYHFTKARLQNIVAQLQNGHRNVVEFRHASWWTEEVYAAFREASIIFCSCSAPNLPDELVETADDIYIRFHGKKAWYKHCYTQDELQEWAERITAANGKNVWVYFNNTFDAHAVENSRMLARLLSTETR
jgi:uncharacterized protein YecE (DUF72 family)